MVHRNLFYEMGLEIDDPKIELWTKSKVLGMSKNSKISFEVQNWTFEGLGKDKTTLKYIAVPSATILAEFAIKFIYFLMNFIDFWPKIGKID